MKTYIKYICLSLFLLSVVTAEAQSKVVWLGKDVQAIQNNEIFLTSGRTIASLGYPAWIISKDVQGSTDNATVAGNVVSYGYPYWTISKGVQNSFIRQKSVRPSVPVKEPAIVSNTSLQFSTY